VDRDGRWWVGPVPHLPDGLGIDSLALAELVERLQSRLAIVAPDEETVRLRTVHDVQDAVARLVAARHDESKGHT
jgi:hypothetical protein